MSAPAKDVKGFRRLFGVAAEGTIWMIVLLNLGRCQSRTFGSLESVSSDENRVDMRDLFSGPGRYLT